VSGSTDTRLSGGVSTQPSESLPTISLVTPTFNRKEYLAETLESVLGQGYPQLEYVVVDGRSTDGSAELIETRGRELAWWVSEPDDGPWQAVNKGFAHTSGDVLGWLGSDDLLMPWTLSVIGEIFGMFPQVEWLTTLFPTRCDEQGRAVESYFLDTYDAEAFFRGENLPSAGWRAAGFIQQEATFWRRSLWERAGGRLDESLHLAADFELWARFHRLSAKLYGVGVPLACFRAHADQKSHSFQEYVDEAQDVLIRYGGKTQTVPGVPRFRRLLMRVVPQRVRRTGANALAGLLGPMPSHGGLRIVHGGRGQGWRIQGR
jgi:glycosyltransferase involved in cell wall biosynthesis